MTEPPNPVWSYLSLLGFAWYCVLWSLGLLGCHTARRRYRLRPRSPLSSAAKTCAPGVSIIRPLKGLDANLYENLESSFKQEYPNFEILLSVSDEWDQAIPIARDLIAKYPRVDAKILIGGEDVGINPKVNNLIRPYRQAANDIIWVLDSNVSVAPGTLARAVDALEGRTPPMSSKRRIGIVHHVPFATASEPFIGSRIEEAFLNTNHAKMYIAINTVAIESCVVGKSNLYRRSEVERVNGSLRPIVNADHGGVEDGERGLAAFGRTLAEDNMIASALWHELGLRHDLSCDVAQNAIGRMTFSDYVWRRVRWIRVRKHMVLAATFVEPFTECFVAAVIGATSLQCLLGLPPWLIVGLHLPIWLLIDLDVYASLAGHPLPASRRWSFVLAWAIRELLALPIFVLAIFGDEIEWRGRKYRVKRNGVVRIADVDGSPLLHAGLNGYSH